MTRRLLRPAICFALLATLAFALSPASGQAPSGAERLCGDGSDAVLKKGRWTLYAKPKELSRIVAHAVARGADEMLASDGRVVMRSSDKGCTWKQVYEVTEPTGEGTAVEGNLPRISRLLYNPVLPLAYMVVDGVGRAAASRLFVSSDNGETWEQATGLPPAPGFRDIVPAPDSADVMYLTTGVLDVAGQNDPVGASGLLYASQDGGASWSRVGGAGGEVEKVAVEADTGGAYLWVVRSNGTVQHSQDFGATFLPVTMPPVEDPNPADPTDDPPPDHWRDIAVFRFVHVKHVLVATASPTREADLTRAAVSLNKGASWIELEIDGLGPAGGLIFGNAESQIYSSAGSDSTAFRGPGLLEFSIEEQRWRSVDELGLISLKDPRSILTPTATGPNYRSLFFRADRPGSDAPPDLIARFEPPPPPAGLSLGGRSACGDPAAKPPGRKRVRFEPPRIDVKLEPGTPVRAPVKAELPADPTPVDLYFLVDHSDSMDPAIAGLFCSIERLVRELPERNLDMHFGLGAYNDVVRYTYRRLADIKPPEQSGPEISAALKTLFTLRGAHEPLRSALYQTATGAGLDKAAQNPDGPGSVQRHVEPGQQANWRDSEKVLRATLVITDEPYEESTDGEPPLEQVVASLKAKRMRVLGLRVIPYATEQTNPNDPDHHPQRQLQLQQQLTNLARETGALAPKGGIDCDGGGSPDVAEGQPIVCSIDESGIKRELDDTLVAVLQSLVDKDVKPVKLVPRKTSGLQASVEEGPVELDIHKDNELRSTAVLSCTPEQQGKRFDLEFDVVAGEKVLDTITGTAQCGELPAAVIPPVPGKPAAKAKPKPAAKAKPNPAPERAAPPEPQTFAPSPPVQAPQPAVAVAPPPPPPAPAPVSSAPVAANAVATNPGAAAQEHREVAVKAAVVSTHEGADRDAAREYAMVRSRPDSFPARTPAHEFELASQRVAVRSGSPRSAVPVPALVTLGVGFSGLFLFVAASAVPKRRGPKLTPARAEAEVPR